MPNHKSAERRVNTSNRQNAYNRHYKSMMKTAVKKVRSTTTPEEAKDLLVAAQSILDKLVTKGVIKKNKASNQKSKLMRLVNKMAAPVAN